MRTLRRLCGLLLTAEDPPPPAEIILELQEICFICGHVPLLHPNMAFVFFALISGYAKFVYVLV